MKKIVVLAVVTVLAGCASDSETMQLTTSSSEEVYSAEQIAMMGHPLPINMQWVYNPK